MKIFLPLFLLIFAVSSFGQTRPSGLITAHCISPEAAVKSFTGARTVKHRHTVLKAAEKDFALETGHLINGSTFRGGRENDDSAQKTNICTVQTGNGDSTTARPKAGLTRTGDRVRSIDYAAAHCPVDSTLKQVSIR